MNALQFGVGSFLRGQRAASSGTKFHQQSTFSMHQKFFFWGGGGWLMSNVKKWKRWFLFLGSQTHSINTSFSLGTDCRKATKIYQQNLGNICLCRWPTFFSSEHQKYGSAAQICDWVNYCHIMQLERSLCHHCVINNSVCKNRTLAF